MQMPGIAPLIQNLVSSISAKASSGIRNKDLAEWQREYLTGLTQEIYSVPLPRHFRGRTFTDLSLELYRRYSLLLFGLERIRGGRLHVVKGGFHHLYFDMPEKFHAMVAEALA